MPPSATASPELANALRAFRLTLAIAVSREIAGLKIETPLLQSCLAEFEGKEKEWRNRDGATLAQINERLDWISGREPLALALAQQIEERLAAFVAENSIEDLAALRILSPAFVEEIWPRRLDFYVPAAREVLIRALKRLSGGENG